MKTVHEMLFRKPSMAPTNSFGFHMFRVQREDTAHIAVESPQDTKTATSDRKRSKKQVRFHGEIIEIRQDMSVSKAERRKLWYSACDYDRFRRENIAMAKYIRDSMKLGENLWFELFQQVHQDLSTSSPNYRETQVIPCEEHLQHFHIVFHGLETLVLQSYLRDRARRKESLYNQIHYWQRKVFTDANRQQQILQTVSQDLSRPCCRLARFSANVVAASPVDNM